MRALAVGYTAGWGGVIHHPATRWRSTALIQHAHQSRIPVNFVIISVMAVAENASQKKFERIKTYFNSFSSRKVSCFCFLMSSRLRRASARSLTALSLSLRRLSHRVLKADVHTHTHTYLETPSHLPASFPAFPVHS